MIIWLTLSFISIMLDILWLFLYNCWFLGLASQVNFFGSIYFFFVVIGALRQSLVSTNLFFRTSIAYQFLDLRLYFIWNVYWDSGIFPLFFWVVHNGYLIIALMTWLFDQLVLCGTAIWISWIIFFCDLTALTIPLSFDSCLEVYLCS